MMVKHEPAVLEVLHVLKELLEALACAEATNYVEAISTLHPLITFVSHVEAVGRRVNEQS